jgi:hypothetical protein
MKHARRRAVVLLRAHPPSPERARAAAPGRAHDRLALSRVVASRRRFAAALRSDDIARARARLCAVDATRSGSTAASA